MKLLSLLLFYLVMATSSYAYRADSNLSVNNSKVFTTLRDLHVENINKIDRKWIDGLRYYRGFFKSGEQLQYQCKDNPKVNYKSTIDRDLAKLGFLSTAQLLILEETIPAIAKYSDELELSDDQYKNLYENIMAESCSQNISVMSHRKIRKKFKFARNNNYVLPSIEGNPFFDQNLLIKQSRELRLFQELHYTVGLFKAACSWGQRYENLRLMRPLMENEIFASYVIRNLSQRALSREDNFGPKIIVSKPQATRVNCAGIICRKEDTEEFKRNFPRGVGSRSLTDDIVALYCQDIKNSKDEEEIELDPRYETLFTEYKDDDHYRLVGQMIALISKYPSYNVWSQDKSTLAVYTKLGIDRFFNMWATNTGKEMIDKLNYEEPLIVEPFDYRRVIDYRTFKPKIILEINSGDFDRGTSVVGKLNFKYDLKIFKKDLLWIYRQFKTYSFKDDEYKKADQLLRGYVTKAYEKFEGNLSEYVVGADVRELIVDEVKRQLLYFNNADMRHQKGKFFTIPIEFKVGAFALTYMKNKRLMRKHLNKEMQKHKMFEMGQRIDSMAEDTK
jgi:hypothetical protein